jgi:hypothetical protein
MRIRQIRPEFFTDPVTAHLPPVVRLTYIGLWCVADDAGYLVWDVAQIGALLSPYMSVRGREKLVTSAGDVLADKGRLVFYECGCALLPKLANHQKIGGNKSFPIRDLHRVHTSTDTWKAAHRRAKDDSAPFYTDFQEVHTSTDLSDRNVTVGNVTVGNGNSARKRDEDGSSEFQEKVPRLVALGSS